MSIPTTIVAAGIALAFVVIGAFFLTRDDMSDVQVAEWGSTDNGGHGNRFYEVPLARIEAGIAEDNGRTAPEIDVSTGAALLVVPASFLDKVGSLYELFIYDFGGDEVWSDEVPHSFIEDGRMTIRLEARGLTPGKYTLQLIEIDSSGFSAAVAEAGFRISHW
ncbi:MAG: hypothetical protein OEN01_01500 [Candidatus Krumholzibacteria bacterium]|nr:hypothetical protein [Candidatus Krumholzibacteria bacterium]